MTRRTALLEERDFLFRSLDDLDSEHARGEIDDKNYERLHDSYVARAADVLVALENPAGARRRPTPGGLARRRLVGAAAVVLVGVFAGILVARTAGERAEGGFITGDQVERSATARLAEAQALFGEGEVLGALQTIDGILADDPDDLAARSFRGWILVSIPDDELRTQGRRELDQVLVIDPDFAEALLFRGATHRADGELNEALALYERLLAQPDDLPMRPVVEGIVEEIRAELGSS